MFALGYLVMSVLFICVYPWVSSDVSVAHMCWVSHVPVFTLGYLVISVLLICDPWVSSDVSVAQLCLPLGI